MHLAPDMLVGQHVRLQRPLGKGAMGRVWVGEHTVLEIPVAVKFLAANLSKDDPTHTARFRREAKTAAAIRSPHAVQILEYGVTEEDYPYIVMELLEGRTLAERLEHVGPLGLRDTRKLVDQVCKALGRAHQLGIVHRDIKPENIFLLAPEDDLFVKVLDFGLAKRTGALRSTAITNAGNIIGTPQYMSPEQLLDADDPDHRCDLWALGVVAQEALTGEVPFSGATLTALAIAVTTTDPAPPSDWLPGLSPDVDEWFRQALSRAREGRFQSAEEMADAFADATHGADVAAAPRVLANRSGRTLRFGVADVVADGQVDAADSELAAAVSSKRGALGLTPAEDPPLHDASTSLVATRSAAASTSAPPSAPRRRRRSPFFRLALGALSLACGFVAALVVDRVTREPSAQPRAAAAPALLTAPRVAATPPAASSARPAVSAPSARPARAKAPKAKGATGQRAAKLPEDPYESLPVAPRRAADPYE